MIPTAATMLKSRVGTYAKRPSGETVTPCTEGVRIAGPAGAMDPSGATVSPRTPPSKRYAATPRVPSGVNPSPMTPVGAAGSGKGEPGRDVSVPSWARAKPEIASGVVP